MFTIKLIFDFWDSKLSFASVCTTRAFSGFYEAQPHLVVYPYQWSMKIKAPWLSSYLEEGGISMLIDRPSMRGEPIWISISLALRKKSLELNDFACNPTTIFFTLRPKTLINFEFFAPKVMFTNIWIRYFWNIKISILKKFAFSKSQF